ncbi:AbrB/MazE/SpoVT family DNA-binding domain-containing protein [Haloterrigena salinisoli]
MTRFVAKISSQGQIVVPVDIRDEYDISPGDRVEMSFDGKFPDDP